MFKTVHFKLESIETEFICCEIFCVISQVPLIMAESLDADNMFDWDKSHAAEWEFTNKKYIENPWVVK